MRDGETVPSLEDVTKEFPGVKALDKVRFTLRRGEVHAFCGENGAGKSTLMKIISGLHKPDSLGLHRRRACIRARLDGLDAAAREIATPKANCILDHTEHLGIGALAQPSSVSNMARRTTWPRLRETAKTSSAARCSSLALTGDLPAMPCHRESIRRRNHDRDLLVKFRESA